MNRNKIFLSIANRHDYDWRSAEPPQGVYVAKGFWCADFNQKAKCFSTPDELDNILANYSGVESELWLKHTDSSDGFIAKKISGETHG
jgi:hypothetical protein